MNAYFPPTSYAPTYGYGWGALKLDSVLRFDNSTFDLFVKETITLAQDDYVDFCFLVPHDVTNLTESNGFRATVVWSDPPADIMADAMLVNNLVSTSVHFYANTNTTHTHEYMCGCLHNVGSIL
jgi:hypothetical protein